MFTQVPETVFPHIESQSARDFYLGLSYLLYPLFMFFGASFLGDLSDIYGRKKVLLSSMAGIFLSFILMSWGIASHSLFLFLFGRAFSGLMAGSQPLCMAAIADLSTPDNKAWNMSLVTLTNCIGLIFGPFVGGVFTETYFLKIFGYPFPFLLAAIFAVIGFFLILGLFQETFMPNISKKVKISRPVTIFCDALSNNYVHALVWVVLFQMMALMIYYQTIGVYLREFFNYSSANLGFFYGFMGIFFALGILIVVPFALKRWRVEAIAAYGFLFMGIFALASVFYKNEIYIWVDVIPFAAIHAMGFTGIAAVFSNCADEKNQGWVMGVLAATCAIAYVLAGLSTNLLPYLGIRGVIALGGIFGIFSGLLMIGYAVEHKAHGRHHPLR